MVLQWFLAAFGVIVSVAALAAFRRSRRLAKRIDRLAESYWELRYEQGQLGARLARLEGGAGDQPPTSGTAAFVPLSSLKKM